MTAHIRHLHHPGPAVRMFDAVLTGPRVLRTVSDALVANGQTIRAVHRYGNGMVMFHCDGAHPGGETTTVFFPKRGVCACST